MNRNIKAAILDVNKLAIFTKHESYPSQLWCKKHTAWINMSGHCSGNIRPIDALKIFLTSIWFTANTLIKFKSSHYDISFVYMYIRGKYHDLQIALSDNKHFTLWQRCSLFSWLHIVPHLFSYLYSLSAIHTRPNLPWN